MRVLITGGGGQVGRALRDTRPANSTILSAGHDTLDITDPDNIAGVVDDFRPDILINAAAYTTVDKAENEPEAAFRVNAEAVGHLARVCDARGCRLVQISTDFVFDGAQSHPYSPDDAAAPLGVYGASKLAGEHLAGEKALIVRTAWIHAARGHNFVLTMLRVMAERDEVRVIADQVGSPTHATDLARALWGLIDNGATGIHHYTDAGVASWYDFAVAIAEEALAAGLLVRTVPVAPIAAIDYPLPARRPAYSVLDCRATWRVLGSPAPHWRSGLRAVLREIRENG